MTAAKLVLIVVVLLIMSPAANHALARAARKQRVQPDAEKKDAR